MRIISVTKRSDDYHASTIAGHWDCGRTPAEAIGNLVMSWPEKFGLEVHNISKRGPVTERALRKYKQQRKGLKA